MKKHGSKAASRSWRFGARIIFGWPRGCRWSTRHVCARAEIEVDPVQLEVYKAAAKEVIENSVRLELGVLALYSVSDKDNPAHVTLFEMYADRDAYKAHLETPHFKKYKITTQDMVRSLKLRDTVPIALSAKAK